MTSVSPWFAGCVLSLWCVTAAGYEVENPAEPGQVEGWTWEDYMRRGLAQLLTCDGVALLPGWTESKGACIEADIASLLGMRLWAVDEWAKAVA